MGEGGHHGPADAWEWRREALAAAGVVGLWEWDHGRGTARYCPGAAGLLAGDPGMAWRDLAPAEALTGVHADDAARLRARMERAVGSDGVWADECRVRLTGDGARRVLCRGRTYRGADGVPTRTLGVVVDVTDGREGAAGEGTVGPVPEDGRAALDRAAEHGLAAFEAIRASGIAHLLAPARTLLLEIGRAIARGQARPDRRSH